MKQQWTTVTDNVKKASHDAGHIVSLSQDDSRKNRRIALALASTGVFLILVGATPFVFNGSDSGDYAAFLGQDPEFVGVNAVPAEGDGVGIPADDLGSEVLDLGAEPVEVDIPEVSNPPVASGDTRVIPAPPMNPPDMGGSTPAPSFDPVPVEVFTPTPYPTLEPLPTDPSTQTYPAAGDEIPAGNDEIITEMVDFPVNIHVDGSAEPVDYTVVVGEEFHMAAPEQPESGAPLLPLLAFSGAAAAWMRAKHKKRTRR